MAEAEQTPTPATTMAEPQTPSSASTISEQMTPTTEATPSSATSMAEHTPAPAPPVATPPPSSTWRKKPSQKGKTRHKLAKLPTLATPKRAVAAAAAAKKKKKKRKGGDGERSKPVRRKLDLDGERAPAPPPKIITPRSGTFYRAALIDNLRSLAKLTLTGKPKPPRRMLPPPKMKNHLRCFGRSQLMENLKSLAKRHNLLIPAAAAAAKGKRGPKKKKSEPKVDELEIVVYSRKRAAGAPSPRELVLYNHELSRSLTLRWISVPLLPLLADVKKAFVMGITPEIETAHGELMRLEETCRGEEMGDSIPESPQLNVMREELGRKVKRFMASTRFVIGKMDFDHPWGGTVVDSVVGTFLTQNVADHTSSNAFMIIAATFAVSKNGSNVEQSKSVPLLTDGCDLGELEPENAGCSDEGAKCRDKDIEELIESLRTGEISNWDEGRIKKVLCDRFEDSTAVKIFRDIVSIRVKDTSHWDSLREEVYKQGYNKENSAETIDWEALLHAPFAKITACIKDRGNQSQMAFRILAFLIRIKRDHGSIDLEWLRHVPRAKAKRYLLSIKGLGAKSVDCIRLLSLRHRAFPVDTNVARIATRLGWVELQPLPKGQEFHLVDKYPVMANIQKYLEPLLCNIPARHMYELHYQMITFGKAICTKKQPNCGSCPLRKECKYFNSLVKRAECAFLGSQQHKTGQTNMDGHTPIGRSNPEQLHQYQIDMVKDTARSCNKPIVEEPTTPPHEDIGAQSDNEYEDEFEDSDIEEQEEVQDICGDIEDAGFDIVIDLRSSKPIENPTEPLHGKEIIPITQPSADSPAMIKKYRLRTEYTAYEIPDGHEILDKFEPRVLGECNPYLLIIRSRLDEHTVNATILIPSRTANRNIFPLDGSYYQPNEVFTDHSSRCSPIEIKTNGIWALRRCTVYFGKSIHSVSRGQTGEEIQKFYYKGYISNREFDRRTRLPYKLSCELHDTNSGSKRPKTYSSPPGTQDR